MSSINICLVQPLGYIHSHAFLELGELVFYSLKELNFDATMGFNKINPGVKNIIIGCHLLDPALIQKFPQSTVILNTEQIYADPSSWTNNIFAWSNSFEVWDYSERNLIKLNEIGARRAKLLKIGFQKELMRISDEKDKDVDILFYGSINERRMNVIDLLKAKGMNIKTLFGVYGKERDEWIERSKLVLNLHLFKSHIFEIVRVFYLLTNSVVVVGEVSESTSIDNRYKDGIIWKSYDDLVDGCIEVVRDNNLRDRMKNCAFNTISQYPQKLFTQEVIEN
jgi:hypothetical protein